MKRCLPLLLSLAILLLSFQSSFSQTLYDFSIPATLSSPIWDIWKTRAVITIGGVDYKLDVGGNGSLSNSTIGGRNGTAGLRKSSAGGDMLSISRVDGLPFQIYGFWLKQQSMNSVPNFTVPPWYVITYYINNGVPITYGNMTPKQGGPNDVTITEAHYQVNYTVTQVQINFTALHYFILDDLMVGLPLQNVPSFSVQPANMNVCVNGSTNFSVAAQHATVYQWQVNTGSGFSNLLPSPIYQNVFSPILTITGAGSDMNGYQYRCMVSGASTIYSNPGILTVKTPVATIDSRDATCYGTATGSAMMITHGTTGNVTYNWTPAVSTGSMANNLSAGHYSVTATDGMGCSITKEFDISQPDTLRINSRVLQDACYEGNNGYASVQVTGGRVPYQYEWSHAGSAAPFATGLTAGKYSVIVTDQQGCQLKDTVTINEREPIILTPTQTNVSCYGENNGALTLEVSGGAMPYVYNWSHTTQQLNKAENLSPGVYSVEVRDANQCIVTHNFTITEPPVLTVTPDKTNESICSGETTSIALSGQNASQFNWIANSMTGNVTGFSNGSGHSIAQQLSGEGTVKYTITPVNENCSGNAAEVIVTVNYRTEFTSQAESRTILLGESTFFEVSAANALSYQWQVNPGSGYVNISDDQIYSGASTKKLTILNATANLNGGLYRCIIAGSCIAELASEPVSLTVTIKSNQTISFNAIPSLVYGDSQQLVASTTAGLPVTFTSGDESIAAIIDGKLHAKRFGAVQITASQAGNNEYNPAEAVTHTVLIGKRTVQVSINPAVVLEKTYDGINNFLLPGNALLLENVIPADDLSVSAIANFDLPHAGNNKLLTIENLHLSGLAAGNYELGNFSVTTTGTILKKEVFAIVNPIVMLEKTYDGSRDLELTTSPVLLMGPPPFAQVHALATASFENSNAGFQVVTLNIQSLAGQDMNNFTLTTTTLTANGSIHPKMIGVSRDESVTLQKTYDGTTIMRAENLGLMSMDIVEGDMLSFQAEAAFESGNAGNNIPVSIRSIRLDGADKNNYVLSNQDLSAVGSIQPYVIDLQFSPASTVSKTYDGTTTAEIGPNQLQLPALFGEDEVLLEVTVPARFLDKNAGTGKEVLVDGLQITGKDVANYLLKAGSISAPIGTILPRPVTIQANATTKVYGNTDPEFGYTIEGVIDGESFTGALSRTAGNNAGEYEISIGTLSGGTNYTIEDFEPAVFTITQANLLIRAEAKTKKQGQPNPGFTFQYIGLKAGDQPSDLETPPVATTLAGTGSPIGIYPIQVAGASSANYSIAFEAGQLTITPASAGENLVQAWSSSSDLLQIRIYAERDQKASIVLYTMTGQTLILEAKQLNKGVNTHTISTAQLTPGTYILGVYGQYFKEADKLKIK